MTHSFHIAVLLLLSAAPATHLRAQPPDSATVLFRYDGRSLHDSKWGRIAELQRALHRVLQGCGRQAVDTDGIFGPATRAGIIALYGCPGYEHSDSSAAPGRFGVVDIALWRRLLPGSALPSVRERAFVLSLSHEATDYDRVEWNYRTSDDRSALTWDRTGQRLGGGMRCGEFCFAFTRATRWCCREYSAMSSALSVP